MIEDLVKNVCRERKFIMEEQAKEITPKQVEEYIEKQKSCIIVDVREDMEVAQGMIEEAKHIPLQSLPFSLDQLDKSKEIICVCRSGQRSNSAALYLNEQGYNAVNMVGGMLEWGGEIIFK